MKPREIREILATKLMGWVPVMLSAPFPGMEDGRHMWWVGDGKPVCPFTAWRPCSDARDAVDVLIAFVKKYGERQAVSVDEYAGESYRCTIVCVDPDDDGMENDYEDVADVRASTFARSVCEAIAIFLREVDDE